MKEEPLMNKAHKLILIVFLISMLITSNSIVVYAGTVMSETNDKQKVFAGGMESTEAVYDSEIYKDLIFEPPVSDPSSNQIEGIDNNVFPQDVTPINKFGLNYNGSNYVYTQPSESSAIVGTIFDREIVTVQWQSGVWYYIEYKTSSGESKFGYILGGKISIPSYNYTRPITTGTRGTDYNPPYHNGIDIPIDNAPVYAITSGTAEFKYYKRTDPYTSAITTTSFGNFVKLNTSQTAYYAHLSSFNGYPVSPYPSEQRMGYLYNRNTCRIKTGKSWGISG